MIFQQNRMLVTDTCFVILLYYFESHPKHLLHNISPDPATDTGTLLDQHL